jgi:predicted phosphodiesterase
MSAKSRWTCEQLQRNVFSIDIPLKRNGEWEAWVFIASDIHLDSKHCNRKLLQKHLELAQERSAPIIFTGDNFDAMQSRGDKRHQNSDLIPEMLKGSYADALVESCADWLKPFARSIAIIGDGNHESSFRQKLEVDLNQRLIGYLNILVGSKIKFGNYAGWVLFNFRGKERNQRRKVLHYHHGSGYTSQAAYKRASAMWPDSDICTYGHDHKSAIFYEDRDRISTHGVQFQDQQMHLKLGTYKNAYADGSSGYEVERGHGVRGLGGYFLKFTWDRPSQRVIMEPFKAQ